MAASSLHLRRTAVVIALIATATLAQAPPAIVTQWDVASPLLSASAGSGTPVVGVGGLVIGYNTQYFQSSPGSIQISTTSQWPSQGTASGTAGVQMCASTVGFGTPLMFSFYARYSGNAMNYHMLQWSATGAAGPWTNVLGGPISFSNTGSSDNQANGAWWFTGNYTLATAGAGANPNFCLQLVAVFKPSTSTYTTWSNSAYNGLGGQVNYDLMTLFGVPPLATLSNITLVGAGGVTLHSPAGVPLMDTAGGGIVYFNGSLFGPVTSQGSDPTFTATYSNAAAGYNYTSSACWVVVVNAVLACTHGAGGELGCGLSGIGDDAVCFGTAAGCVPVTPHSILVS